MPTPTAKLGLSEPLGNETFNRAAFNNILDEIDQAAALAPYIPKSATYDSGNDQVNVTIGKGRADYGGGNIVSTTSDSTVVIASPTVSTTYYVFLNNDGTFSTGTVSTPGAGQTLLASVAVGATKSDLTTTDMRGILPGASPLDVALQVDTSGQLLARADLDMQDHVLKNIGAAGTDFTPTGGLTLSDTLTLNSQAQVINNAGNTQIEFHNLGTKRAVLQYSPSSGQTSIIAYDNTGAFIGSPLIIDMTTGNLTSSGVADFQGTSQHSFGGQLLVSGNVIADTATGGSVLLQLGGNDRAWLNYTSSESIEFANRNTSAAYTPRLNIDGEVDVATVSWSNVGLMTYPNEIAIASSASIMAPSSGTHLEIRYQGASDQGEIVAYDRTNSVYKALRLGASNVILSNGTIDIQGTAISSIAGPLQIGDNLQISGAGNYVYIDDRSTDTSTPTSGGYLYPKAGALYWRGSSGTITQIAPS